MNKPVVLLTGASSGFGLLTSISLLKNGFLVIATMRNLEKGQVLKESIPTEYLDSLEIVKLDVTDHEGSKETVKELIERIGKIDVLVNNAGYAEAGFGEEVTMERYRQQFETNFFGLVAMTQFVLPHMRERKQGKIINISSVSGRFGFPALSPYAASKHAVEGFSESLRLEMLPFGVYVSLIEPGSYQTEIWSKGLIATNDSQDSPYQTNMNNIMKAVKKTAANAGNPQEVADLIVQVAASTRPKLRYPIGKSVSHTLLLKKIFPWEWLEKQVLKQSGI